MGLSMQKQQVRRFYQKIWDSYDKTVIASVLHRDFTFRGSLGQQLKGHDGFAQYLDMVHKALGDYHCAIEELVQEGDKVFAKMCFSGVHRNEFMGYAATNAKVSWQGCALFSFEGEKVIDLWVLGDLQSLQQQLVQNQR